MSNTRKAAVDIIESVASGERLDSALNAAKNLDERERRLAAAIAMAAVRHRFLIEKYLRGLMQRPFRARESNPAKRRAYALLLAGAAQILYLDIPAHAAVGETMNAANKSPYKKLINGVLRSLVRKLEATEIKTATPDAQDIFPDWLKDNLVKAYGAAATIKIATDILQPPPLDICFKDKAAAVKFSGEYQNKCETIADDMRRLISPGDIAALPFYGQGDWWVQDIAATLPARILLSLYKNDGDILDLCAAPGGKSLQLASWLNNNKQKNKTISVDNNNERLNILRKNLARTKLTAEIIASDILTWQPQNKFSYILLDAPCSASGTLRRNPDILWQRFTKDAEKHLAAAQATQRVLLAKAAEFAAVGGELIYCVCSLLPQEGEEVIADFLRARKDFMAVPIAPLLGFTATEDGVLRSFTKDSQHPCDGFFIAHLRKIK